MILFGLHINKKPYKYKQSTGSLDGANCRTAFGARLTQKEAAVQAVKEIGLNQIQEVKKEFFTELPQYYSMFNRRLTLLRHV